MVVLQDTLLVCTVGNLLPWLIAYQCTAYSSILQRRCQRVTIFLSTNTTPIERHLTFTLVFVSTQASATEIFLAAVFPGFQCVHNCVYTLHIYLHSTEPYMFLEARMRDINFVITPEVCSGVCVLHFT
jgi:hypothetical protein